MKHAGVMTSAMQRGCARIALWTVALSAFLTVSLVQAGPVEFKVMTRNVYGIGADLTPVFTAAPGAVPFVIADAIAAVSSSKPERDVGGDGPPLWASDHAGWLRRCKLFQSRARSFLSPLRWSCWS